LGEVALGAIVLFASLAALRKRNCIPKTEFLEVSRREKMNPLSKIATK
jgi:hypothetical protein